MVSTLGRARGLPARSYVLVWSRGGVGTIWVWYGTWYGTVWHVCGVYVIGCARIVPGMSVLA